MTGREAYVQTAALAMAADADERAPGAAITVALCGSWQHEPPCPLAAHHTSAERVGDELRLRVLFAADPDDEPLVRERIAAALAAGELLRPDGVPARWRLLRCETGAVSADESAHARRLTVA
jgi:hypothetical protein